MKAVLNTSGFRQINFVDIGKAIRNGLVALAGAFVAGSMGAVQGMDITSILAMEPKAILALVVLAGCTGAFDLLRRYLTDFTKTTRE